MIMGCNYQIREVVRCGDKQTYCLGVSNGAPFPSSSSSYLVVDDLFHNLSLLCDTCKRRDINLSIFQKPHYASPDDKLS